jgi:hypothetical protein
MRQTYLPFSSVLACIMMLAQDVSAQQQQVVQQPTLRTFSVNTSVLAPDQGSASLGGLRSSSSQRSQRGPWNSRSPVNNRWSASGASVVVSIIDLKEMDRAILQEPKTLRQEDAATARSKAISQLKVTGMSETDLEDVDYFLTRAQEARHQRRWEGMDVFLQLAKSKIPAGKRAELLSLYGFASK